MTKTIEHRIAKTEHIGTAATILGAHIIFVTVKHDEDAENPVEAGDENGTIYSFNRRHTNFIDNHVSGGPQAIRKEYGEDAVGLSYYEHGNCLWMVADGPTPPGVEFEWDGVRFAGVWVPDQGLMGYGDEIGPRGNPERRARMLQYAREACESYTSWSNGEVYGYQIEVYEVRKDDANEPYDALSDYRRAKEVEQDSCWGFVGYEYFEQELDEVLTYFAKKYGADHAGS